MTDRFDHLEEAAVILTSTTRLARELLRAHESRRAAADASIWRSPAVLPLEAWLRELWSAVGSADDPVLLNPRQEQELWRRIIVESEQGAHLLAVEGTARAAQSAWRLLHAWRIPKASSGYGAHEDSMAFLEWSRAYVLACGQSSWTDEARLPDLIGELIRWRKLELPGHVVLAGFDEFTPQQMSLLEELEAAGTQVSIYEMPVVRDARAFRLASGDGQQEIHAAAEWAREILEREPAARIGIVVDDLKPLRSRAERVLQEVLHPDWWTSGARTERIFHVALGPAMKDHPVLDTALAVLRLAEGSLPLARMGSLLRSPFLGSAHEERNPRAILDAQLRRNHPVRLQAQKVSESARVRAPLLAKLLAKWEKARRGFPNKSLPSMWSLRFSKLLAAVAWPGDAVLNSSEFQAVEEGKELLSQLASLDAVTGPMTLGEALDLFEEMAASTTFRATNHDQPVQVMSVAETRGLRFDYLWVLGMSDETWPGQPAPNPFLPRAEQLRRNVPRSSVERVRKDAARTVERLKHSAKIVVFSHPTSEEDRIIRASPLVARLSPYPGIETRAWMSWYPAAPLEQIADFAAPAMAPGSKAAGGVRVLQQQAACPFRAFAEFRLGARPLEQGESGYNPRDRGTFVHRALEALWRELESRQRLASLTEAQISEIVRASVRGVLPPAPDGFARELIDLEQQRASRILTEWLKVELQRAPFRVTQREEKRQLSLGGLEFEARLDRVDELQDGSHVLIDYKTGPASSKSWEGERPDEPQLPVYALTHPSRIGAVTFARVTRDEPAFDGVASNPRTLPGVETANIMDCLERWQKSVDALAAEFAAGRADVEPKYGAETCRYCDLPALCRVSELKGASIAAEEGVE